MFGDYVKYGDPCPIYCAEINQVNMRYKDPISRPQGSEGSVEVLRNTVRLEPSEEAESDVFPQGCSTL